MCIVNYIPIGSDSFILTHNRDESIKRPLASPPLLKHINGTAHIFPVDMKGKGTWIGASQTGRVACLLNGAQDWNQHKPPYRHSRGLVIPAYFSFASYPEFFKSFDFNGLEPFTLVVVENQLVYICTYNGEEFKTKLIDRSKAFLLTSSSIYSEQVSHDKKQQFLNWWDSKPLLSYAEIINRNLKMRYENEADKSLTSDHLVQTVSMTALFHNQQKTRMDYYDLVNDMHMDREILHFSLPLAITAESEN